MEGCGGGDGGYEILRSDIENEMVGIIEQVLVMKWFKKCHHSLYRFLWKQDQKFFKPFDHEGIQE